MRLKVARTAAEAASTGNSSNHLNLAMESVGKTPPPQCFAATDHFTNFAVLWLEAARLKGGVPLFHRGLVEAIAHALKCRNSSRRTCVRRGGLKATITGEMYPIVGDCFGFGSDPLSSTQQYMVSVGAISLSAIRGVFFGRNSNEQGSHSPCKKRAPLRPRIVCTESYTPPSFGQRNASFSSPFPYQLKKSLHV